MHIGVCRDEWKCPPPPPPIRLQQCFMLYSLHQLYISQLYNYVYQDNLYGNAFKALHVLNFNFNFNSHVPIRIHIFSLCITVRASQYAHHSTRITVRASEYAYYITCITVRALHYVHHSTRITLRASQYVHHFILGTSLRVRLTQQHTASVYHFILMRRLAYERYLN